MNEDVWKATWGVPLHHAAEHKGVAFLFLNSADDKGTFICPDLEWTRTHLEKYQSHQHLFVCMHITPFKWTEWGLPCPDLVKQFDRQKNLKGIFHGHDHNEDGVKENNGKHYFFDSHVGGSWGTDYRGYRIVEVLKSGEVLTYQLNPVTRKPVNSNTIA